MLWIAGKVRSLCLFAMVAVVVTSLAGCSSAGHVADPATAPAVNSSLVPANAVGPYGIPRAPEEGRTTLVIAVNDLYRIAGLDGGTEGGLARLRTLRKDLEAEAPDLLLLHAGDALFPSFLSRTYQGEQMVDVLNLLDGRDDDSFDSQLFITFGNHEFDKSRLRHAPMLQSRITESRFTWLGANIEFKKGEDGKPLVDGPHLLPWKVVESGGIRIGIFGLMGPQLARAEYMELSDYLEGARRASAALREKGAEVVIGLTHDFVEKDCELLTRLGEAGPDLILGGHEHAQQRWKSGERWLLKADADARSATVVRLSIDPAGQLSVEPALPVSLADEKPVKDPQVDQRVQEWLAKHDRTYCEQRNQQPGCLADPVGRTRTVLVAEETTIRSRETALGNWLADLMRASFTDLGAQVAFVNSGALRLNEDLLPGDITLADVEGIFEYPTTLRLLRINGGLLQQVVDRAVQQWPGAGHWLQISGFHFRHDPATGKATDLRLVTPEGTRPVDPEETILAVTVDYLVNPGGDQDGYTMLNPEQVIEETGDLKRITLAALAAAGERGIAPVVDGRIEAPTHVDMAVGEVRQCPAVE